MRLIDADVLLNILERERKEHDEYGLSQRADGITDAIMDIIDAPTIEPERWIPVTERLPEKYIGEWLCCTDDGQILILPYDTPGDGSKGCVFYRWDDNGYMYETYNVVAWMPLPEPWRGEEHEL